MSVTGLAAHARQRSQTARVLAGAARRASRCTRDIRIRPGPACSTCARHSTAFAAGKCASRTGSACQAISKVPSHAAACDVTCSRASSGRGCIGAAGLARAAPHAVPEEASVARARDPVGGTSCRARARHGCVRVTGLARIAERTVPVESSAAPARVCSIRRQARSAHCPVSVEACLACAYDSV